MCTIRSASKSQKAIRIESDLLKVSDVQKKLSNVSGIIVPGGFGTRGSEGIIQTANYAREKNIPYLGICFGFQLAAIAFGRNVLSLEDANSTEINADTKNPIVDLLPEQKDVSDMGGSLRLGANEVIIKSNTNAQKIYNSESISKRHRHRYEINKDSRGYGLKNRRLSIGKNIF